MKAKSITTILAALLMTGGYAISQNADAGRQGQARECDGSGFLNQGRGQGNGQGQGMRRGNRDGNGNGNGEQKRDRKRDGSGPGCKQGV
jgi:hypothetical protein